MRRYGSRSLVRNAVSCVFAAVSLSIGLGAASARFDENSDPASKFVQRIKAISAEIEDLDVNAAIPACDVVFDHLLLIGPDAVSRSEYRVRKGSLYLKFIAKSYAFADALPQVPRPLLQVIPPGFDTAVAPNAIQDPKHRAAYIDATRDNEERKRIAALKSKWLRIGWTCAVAFKVFARGEYSNSDADKAVLSRAMDDYLNATSENAKIHAMVLTCLRPAKGNLP